ncbi:MAG: hypothetical protein IJI68_00070 [Eggerthellaceae bacterium]|nr:hypothetical protein [Eggerthellaceae bacterium]
MTLQIIFKDAKRYACIRRKIEKIAQRLKITFDEAAILCLKGASTQVGMIGITAKKRVFLIPKGGSTRGKAVK